MRRLMAILLFLPLSALAQTPVVPEIPFDSVPDFIKLPPDMFLGEAAGVAVNKAGNVFIFSRGNTTGPAYAAAAAQLLEFKPDGTYLREVGHNLYAWSFAHSVKIDPQDNIWAADKGSDMVIKFTPAGRVAMVFGTQAGGVGRGHWACQTSKATSCSHRRLVSTSNRCRMGTLQVTAISATVISTLAWPRYRPTAHGSGPSALPGNGPLQFNTPHSIAVDQQDNIYVADRGNGRIQVLDTSGKFLRQIVINVPVPPGSHAAIGPTPDINGIAAGYGGTTKTMAPGSPWAICITPGPHQVMYASDAYPGRIYKLALDGTVLGVLGRAGKQLKEFGWIHQIACPSENEIYVAELLNWRIQKLELHPAP